MTRVAAAVPRQLRLLPFRGSAAIAAGLLSPAELRRVGWRRLFPDVYIDAGVELDHRLWCEAALLHVGTDAGPIAIGGISAAWLMGVDLLPRTKQQVNMVAPHPRRIRIDGIRLVNAPLPPDDLANFGRLPMTSPERTIFDIARRHRRQEAVAFVDALLHNRVTTIDAARSFALGRPDLHGRQQVATILNLADARAESPMESWLRLTLIDGGLPRPEAQVVVRTLDGRFVARLDLAYPSHRIGIEYEGDGHREVTRFRRDIARINAIQALGWTVVRVTADDLRRSSDLLHRIRALLSHGLST